MKHFIFILSFAFLLNGKTLIPNDKVKHIIAGTLIYESCNNIFSKEYSRLFNETNCLILTILVGAGKELYDSKKDNHTAEVLDFAATIFVPTIHYTIYKW